MWESQKSMTERQSRPNRPKSFAQYQMNLLKPRTCTVPQIELLLGSRPKGHIKPIAIRPVWSHLNLMGPLPQSYGCPALALIRAKIVIGVHLMSQTFLTSKDYLSGCYNRTRRWSGTASILCCSQNVFSTSLTSPAGVSCSISL